VNEPELREPSERDEVVEAVVGAAYEVANVLGAGFLEKVYERALARELVLRGWRVQAQVGYPVFYKGQRVGDYCADLLVADRVIGELKCVDDFANEHLAQSLNYLRASGLKVGVMVNFKKSKVVGRRVGLG
jgi:GxxExxY protein